MMTCSLEPGFDIACVVMNIRPKWQITLFKNNFVLILEDMKLKTLVLYHV